MKKLNILQNILLINFLFLSVQSIAQDINITGLVVNSNHIPVSNVKVKLSGSQETFCYTDEKGVFTLSNTPTDLPRILDENSSINLKQNGSLEFKAHNQSFRMTVFNMLGIAVGPTVYEKNLNGTFILYPNAYIQNLPKGIYIVSVILGNIQKGFKINNFTQHFTTQGLIQTGYAENEDISTQRNIKNTKETPDNKNTFSGEDTLIFEHDYYETTKLVIISHNLNVGTVELDNFGDYSPAIGVEPDKIIYNKQYGNFIEVYGQDSSLFVINIEPSAILGKELIIKAIPVQKFEFLDSLGNLNKGVHLDSSFKFISGIHFEPSGTHFYFPSQVNIMIKKAYNTDSLVIILHNDKPSKICYVPFLVHEPYDKNIINLGFSISHFSDIIIGKGSIPTISENTFKNSDDAISYFTNLFEPNYLYDQEIDIPDDFFNRWYNEVIKYEIANIFDMETLQFAVQDLLLLGQYANYTGQFFEQLSFYNESITSLNEKFNYLYNLIKEECSNLSDVCLKKELALQAAQLNIIAQNFEGINQLQFSELCNGEVLKIVNKITILQSVYILRLGETTQIQYSAENILNTKINTELEWYSDDPSIVKVDSAGKILAIKEGDTYVHAKYCDVENYVLVKVTYLTTDPCHSLPRPVTGTYNSRIFSHCYYENDITHSSHDLRQSVALTIILTENGWNNKYYWKCYESHRYIFTEYNAYLKGKYVITGVKYEQFTYYTPIYDLLCRYGYYYEDDLTVLYGVRIYPNSRTVKVDNLFHGKVISSVGTF